MKHFTLRAIVSKVRERFEKLLATDANFLRRVLIFLQSLQTQVEQKLDSTIASNGRGFSTVDAPKLSPIAKRALEGQGLTEGEIELCRKKLPKYWKQCTDLAVEWEDRDGADPVVRRAA